LYEKFKENPDSILRAQIDNLRKRLNLTRTMQILGVLSLFFCVISMALIYIDMVVAASWVFGLGLLLLIISLAYSIWEINISVKALDLHLRNMEVD
jgi:hypothetical protein